MLLTAFQPSLKQNKTVCFKQELIRKRRMFFCFLFKHNLTMNYIQNHKTRAVLKWINKETTNFLNQRFLNQWRGCTLLDKVTHGTCLRGMASSLNNPQMRFTLWWGIRHWEGSRNPSFSLLDRRFGLLSYFVSHWGAHAPTGGDYSRPVVAYLCPIAAAFDHLHLFCACFNQLIGP